MPFVINLVANLLFTLIFSGLRNVALVAADIVIVRATKFCASLATGRTINGLRRPKGRTSCRCRLRQ